MIGPLEELCLDDNLKELIELDQSKIRYQYFCFTSMQFFGAFVEKLIVLEVGIPWGKITIVLDWSKNKDAVKEKRIERNACVENWCVAKVLQFF